MKTISNKVTTIDGPPQKLGEGTTISLLTYADLMKIVMRQPRHEGLSIADMRKDFRVIDALQNPDGEIKLEDADFEHFKKRMGETRWTAAHKDLIQFEDDINAL